MDSPSAETAAAFAQEDPAASAPAAKAKIPSAGGMLAMVSLPLLAVLLLACAYFFFQNATLISSVNSLNATVSDMAQKTSALSAQNSQLSQSLSSTQASLSSTQSELAAANGRISVLDASVAQKDSSIASLQAELATEQGKRGQLAQDYATLQQNINASMAWFRDNAVFPANLTWSSSIMAKRLGEDCIDRGSLNLGCVSYILTNVGFAIHYRTDTSANGTKNDHLQSLKETINLGWGDCEDYSLLLKSIINMFKQNGQTASIVAWQPGGSTDFRIYPPESKSTVTDQFWYYPNARGVSLGAVNGVFPYVVCYTVDSASGHCVVALSGQEILSSQDTGKLSGAQIFEPQDGHYIGTVGSALGICGNSYCTHAPGEIYLIIADGDLYQHDGTMWAGYADYYAKASVAP